MTNSSFVTVKNTSIAYPVKGGMFNSFVGRQGASHSVLRDVSFSLDQGEWIALFGMPGSGKTTLLRMLAGALKPTKGTMLINGKAPSANKDAAAGYVSSEESENSPDTVNEILHEFGRTHGITNLPSRIGAIGETLAMDQMLYRPAKTLSTTERLRLNLARAALSEAPTILLDDVADGLGVAAIQYALKHLFKGRTLIVATRQTDIADALDLPLLILRGGSLAHHGTRDDIATDIGVRRIVDAWVEDLHYDLLRKLRRHPGIDEVRLLPSDQMSGQRLRITLHSSRYLPAMYDSLSRASVIKIEEIPASLVDILERMS